MFYDNDFSKAERILKEHLQQRKKDIAREVNEQLLMDIDLKDIETAITRDIVHKLFPSVNMAKARAFNRCVIDAMLLDVLVLSTPAELSSMRWKEDTCEEASRVVNELIMKLLKKIVQPETYLKYLTKNASIALETPDDLCSLPLLIIKNDIFAHVCTYYAGIVLYINDFNYDKENAKLCKAINGVFVCEKSSYKLFRIAVEQVVYDKFIRNRYPFTQILVDMEYTLQYLIYYLMVYIIQEFTNVSDILMLSDKYAHTDLYTIVNEYYDKFVYHMLHSAHVYEMQERRCNCRSFKPINNLSFFNEEKMYMPKIQDMCLEELSEYDNMLFRNSLMYAISIGFNHGTNYIVEE